MTPATPAPAASVLLLRGTDEPRLYLVHRSPRLRFLGGFHAFPGGKVDAADAALTDGTPHSAQRRAALRELFEETGVLLVPAPGEPLAWRRDLLAAARPFADLVPGTLTPEMLPYAGRLVTPAFSPLRYDTAFFVADCPAGQEPEVWPGELESGAWYTAREALAAWDAGAILLSPPTVALLLALAGKARAEFLATCRTHTAAIEAEELSVMWLCPGLRMLPLRAPALPPAAYTNAFLAGTGPSYLIDPGPTDPDEQAKLLRFLDGEVQRQPLTAVILTHHHIDHVGAATLIADRYGVPVWAHADAAARLVGQVTVARHLQDGEILQLGEAPTGRSWHLEAHLTPGHAPGHLAFRFPEYGVLLAADLVSTLSSVIVAPPDGNLRDYLASLRRMQAVPLRLLLPSHGGPSSRPAQVLADALEHRLERERQLLAALAAGPRTLAELVPEVYRGVPRDLWSLAEMQLVGNLEKLRDEGRVRLDGDRWEVVGG